MADFDLQARLGELGLTLPPPPAPVASYLPGVASGDLVFVSGQLPMKDGQLLAVGPVPTTVSLEQAQAAARQCVLNALSIIDAGIGGKWSRFVRMVRIGVFVQSADDFTQQHLVANGASDLLVEILGDAGRHARAAVGVNALPLGASVEIEFAAEIVSKPPERPRRGIFSHRPTW
jgi:enamine deaminase RidA (YjgF/YER057c/UK114 family)